MSYRYFTSDLHFGSTNILKYAKRPFSSAEDAVVKLCQNANATVGYADMLIHVGDFMLAKSDKHDAIEDIGLKYKKEDYLAMFKSRVFLLTGNHDDHNACEPDAKMMVIDLNQNWRNVTVGHYPSYAKGYCGFKGTEMNAHVHLCGHVHGRFFIKWDEDNHVLNYNVGVDCHDYKPVRDAEITADLDYLWNAKIQAPFEMTRAQFEEWKKKNEAFVEAERKRRKEDKYKKRGLSPEECQRRKEEALRKKGLL